MRGKKGRFEQKEVKSLDILRDRNHDRKFYQYVSKAEKGSVPSTYFCKDKIGGEALDRWQEFF